MNCPGIVFHYKKTAKILKDKSCPGCELCKDLLTEFYNIDLNLLSPGKKYRLYVQPKGYRRHPDDEVDWEFTLGLEEV